MLDLLSWNGETINDIVQPTQNLDDVVTNIQLMQVGGYWQNRYVSARPWSANVTDATFC